jgi:hypothetical protein
MKKHKTTTPDTVTTFRHGTIIGTVKAALKIKHDRSAWQRNPSKKNPPVLPSA